ncbi:hypothetical protein [Streptosporangium sp. LJ11]|uniref:hypothetical protein n=1 Tax=Streptosporangium sp. LJ11 TaxID=3436927 RepID=UPI003F7A13FB
MASGLLAEPPGGPDYRFSHALVRDALLSGLGRLPRARLHLLAGECLETRPGTEPATLAHHFAAAVRVGGAAKAVEHASRAAGRAREHAREAAETHRRLGLAYLEERSLRLLARLS